MGPRLGTLLLLLSSVGALQAGRTNEAEADGPPPLPLKMLTPKPRGTLEVPIAVDDGAMPSGWPAPNPELFGDTQATPLTKPLAKGMIEDLIDAVKQVQYAQEVQNVLRFYGYTKYDNNEILSQLMAFCKSDSKLHAKMLKLSSLVTKKASKYTQYLARSAAIAAARPLAATQIRGQAVLHSTVYAERQDDVLTQAHEDFDIAEHDADIAEGNVQRSKDSVQVAKDLIDRRREDVAVAARSAAILKKGLDEAENRFANLLDHVWHDSKATPRTRVKLQKPKVVKIMEDIRDVAETREQVEANAKKNKK